MSDEKFKFRSIKELPAVYEDALSYYEVLAKMSYKLNEVIEQLNQYDPESVVNQVITERLEAYTASTVTPLFQTVSDELTELQSDVNNAIGELNTRVTNIGLSLNTIEARCKEYTDEEVAKVVYNLPLMPSPITGEMVTIFQAIADVASMARASGLTVSEYDGVGLTASEYDNLGLSVYQYDWYGKNYIN